MRVVLDTNVLVSGLLNPYGAPGEIVRLVSAGLLELCHDARILAEYRDVLLRSRFGFDSDEVDALLDQIRVTGHPVASVPLHKKLPDPDDEVFLEVAVAGKAECLVTGNMKHYPASYLQGIRVIPPAGFIELYRKSF